jgi:hypothetical protein
MSAATVLYLCPGGEDDDRGCGVAIGLCSLRASMGVFRVGCPILTTLLPSLLIIRELIQNSQFYYV